MKRRRIMATANALRALLFVAATTAILLNVMTIWWLFGVVLALAVCEVFYDMSAQAFLPSIVDDHQLEKANGRLYAAEVAANSFVGLPLGTWLDRYGPRKVQAGLLTVAALGCLGFAFEHTR